ncbi:MAG: pyridoxine 5'-phosphate synthase [Victivallaceae bacterium]
MLNLGVNVDHVATIRQARLAKEPSPVEAALICEKSGAWGITAHLREDRRHINDADLTALAAKVKFLNMEMAVTEEMLGIAAKLKPHSCCLVPEKRQELTTEGGLDVVGQAARVGEAIKRLRGLGIVVSLFIDAVPVQIEMASELGADYIELHTGHYANTAGVERQRVLEGLIAGAELANSLGIKVNAGHGIDYLNIDGILEIPHLHELNIGHSIVARAVFTGIGPAVAEMRKLMDRYQK